MHNARMEIDAGSLRCSARGAAERTLTEEAADGSTTATSTGSAPRRRPTGLSPLDGAGTSDGNGISWRSSRRSARGAAQNGSSEDAVD